MPSCDRVHPLLVPGASPDPCRRGASRSALRASVLLCLALLSGCAVGPMERAQQLAREGRHVEALAVLDAAAGESPDQAQLRAARLRERDLATQRLLSQAELARAAGRRDAVRELTRQVLQIDPAQVRAQALQRELERSERQDRTIAEGRVLFAAGRLDEAAQRANEVLSQEPSNAGARALKRLIAARSPRSLPTVQLGPVFQQKVSLEFRDASLKGVFEGLARSSGLNFVFDREARVDGKLTLYLRDVTLDEALRVLLTTQQLERKLLNENTLLIYPGTQAKQREHQELVTRSLYLTNADVKQAQNLVRTIAKTRDIHIDERLNMMVVRDTPEAVQLIEDLLAAIDLPEPEVMLEVEVLEVASSSLQDLGIQWPEQVQYGVLNGFDGQQVDLGDRRSFRLSIANPALLATLRGNVGSTNLLANPTIRARNHEKAKVLIGEKLPVFTTTSTANVGVSSSVSYLDVGIKLEVEPSVQLDDEVIIRVGLEVSNLLRTVSGPAGSIAYQIGTRTTNSSLRLRDGQTQVLAGLINDEDRRTAAGVPGLSTLPVVGKLFGVHSDTRTKTEVVLLITPRVLRNLELPEPAITLRAGGTDGLPGVSMLRLGPQAAVGLAPDGRAPALAEAGAEDSGPSLEVSSTGGAVVGDTVSIALANRSELQVQGELTYDATRFQNAALVATAPAGAAGGSGAGTGGAEATAAPEGAAPPAPIAPIATGTARVPFTLGPRGEYVLVLRVLPAAAGSTSSIAVSAVRAEQPTGEPADIAVRGEASIVVPALP